MTLNGQQVTRDEVIRDYQAVRATLEQKWLRFEDLLTSQPPGDQQMIPDKMTQDYQAAKASLKELEYLTVDRLTDQPSGDQQVTPGNADAVSASQPEASAAVDREHPSSNEPSSKKPSSKKPSSKKQSTDPPPDWLAR
ncbi:hypothetical protein [Endozoicomonas acroporae]|uniref:hypothetical protein n=1 Tax=Endozoicomonas acroporae TaxID=1701104 RepID=UPI003D7B9017